MCQALFDPKTFFRGGIYMYAREASKLGAAPLHLFFETNKEAAPFVLVLKIAKWRSSHIAFCQIMHLSTPTRTRWIFRRVLAPKK
jgi:hypothetical protein